MIMTKRKGNKKAVKAHVRPAIEKKKGQVEQIAKKIKGAKLVALVDIRLLPDRLLQSARKGLRGKAEFIVAKASVLRRAIKSAGKAGELEPKVNVPNALIVGDLTAYSLFKYFKDHRANVAAKPGQIAPFDIIVHEGETDLMPGPALSELKGAGINAQIKGGKIVIAKDSTVAKTGVKITDAMCKALQKLNVLPFKAGLTMVGGVEGGKYYEASILDIDEAKLVSDLTAAMHNAYSMSVNVSYFTEDNRQQLLSGAVMQARALAMEAGVYSESNMEMLLASALRMGAALEGKVPQEGATA
jgi:large subunit ribosomal protein L10